MASAFTIRTKRVYEQPSRDDGTRILVDRLWPRGLTKEKAKVDIWLKDIAPSTELRKWYHHEPEKWTAFTQRYQEELDSNPEPLHFLQQQAEEGTITLLYSARDEAHNQATFLQQRLLQLLQQKSHMGRAGQKRKRV